MKYEMIFGDEKLFDGAPLDSVCVERFINTELVSVYVHHRTIDALLNTLIEREAVSCASNRPDIAIRRIIKEPKRWTREDKKAGRLPEVGCRAIWNDDNGMKYTVKIETAFFGNECAVSIDDEGIYFAEKFDLFPIETPAEKAQREEDELIRSLAGTDIHYGTGTVKEIFDQGARAAYRKLKGGE